jgi:hypothetical protein
MGIKGVSIDRAERLAGRMMVESSISSSTGGATAGPERCAAREMPVHSAPDQYNSSASFHGFGYQPARCARQPPEARSP